MLIVLSILLPLNAHADVFSIKTGNDFLRICKNIYEGSHGKTRDEVEMTGFCLGYIEGIRSMNRENHHYCIPAEAESSDLVKIVYKFMQNHPEILDKHPCVSVTHSFSGAFPCKRKP